MARVIVTAHAKQDVRGIISDLQRRAGHSVASRYAADFKDVYGILRNFPTADRRASLSARLPVSKSSIPTSSSTTAMQGA